MMVKVEIYKMTDQRVSFISQIKKSQLESLSKKFLTFALFALALMFQVVLNKIPPHYLNEFPYKAAYHFYRFYLINIIVFYFYVAFFKK